MMNLIFWTRLFGLMAIICFVTRVIFGSRPVSWLDWMSGMACAIAIYYLSPLFEGPLRKKFRRR